MRLGSARLGIHRILIDANELRVEEAPCYSIPTSYAAGFEIARVDTRGVATGRDWRHFRSARKEDRTRYAYVGSRTVRN